MCITLTVGPHPGRRILTPQKSTKEEGWKGLLEEMELEWGQNKTKTEIRVHGGADGGRSHGVDLGFTDGTRRMTD